MPSSPTILIADDEAHIVYILQGKLTKAGYQVLTARDGGEALELARQHRPTLVITDLNMPGVDGLALCKGLRQDPRTADTPVIMLTGRGHTLPPAEREQTNILHLEAKPFSARQLLTTVQGLLQQNQAA
jgi:CheY-like chemotaxis protein